MPSRVTGLPPAADDADRLRNLETNQRHLQHDAGANADHALTPMRLPVIDANNVTRPQVTGLDVLDRHVPPVGGQDAERFQHDQLAKRLLRVIDALAGARG